MTTNQIVAAADRAVEAQRLLTRSGGLAPTLARMDGDPTEQANLLRFVLSTYGFFGGSCDASGQAPGSWNTRVTGTERRGLLTEISVHFDAVWIYTIRVNGRAAKRTIASGYTDRGVIHEAARVAAKMADEEADAMSQ